MHELLNYVCKELEDLDRKAEKDGKLTAAEIQYGDTLAHFKKNLLSSQKMEEESEYSGRYAYEDNSMRGGSMRGSYAQRRDGRGRYSRERGYSRGEDMVMELKELMQDAPDEKTRQEFQRFIQKIEMM